MGLDKTELKDFLDFKVNQYNNASFILLDPVRIPHMFSKKEDIEISGFIAASLAWGQRPVILKNSMRIIDMMDNDPYGFISGMNPKKDLKPFLSVKHRTFQGIDLIYFLTSLQNIYKTHGGLESVFSKGASGKVYDVRERIIDFRKIFFSLPHPQRTEKHIADPGRGSSAKRINM